MFVGLIMASSTSGQITNILASNDSSFALDRVYAGMLGVNDFSVDSIGYRGFAKLRLGASAKLRVSKVVTVESFIAEDITSAGSSVGASAFFVRLEPTKSFSLTIGKGPQASTFLHRAHPVSSGGQFETFTHNAIPGAAPDVRANLQLGKASLVGSVGVPDSLPEYHLGVSFTGLVVSSWYSGNHHWGGAVTYKSKRTKTIFVARNDLLASTFTLNVNKRYILYTDMGVSTDRWKLIRGEFGILRTFDTGSFAKGLLGLGYSDELRSVRGYLYVTL